VRQGRPLREFRRSPVNQESHDNYLANGIGKAAD
jgi:hypothetical protein